MKGIKPQGKPWTRPEKCRSTFQAILRGKPRGFKSLLAASLGNAKAELLHFLAILAR